MFLPVTMDSAERIVDTIQEIKEKIPSDPFEAELILMAEMVAEQVEKNDKEEQPKEKMMENERERQEAPAPDGKRSSFNVVWSCFIFREKIKTIEILHSKDEGKI